MEEEKRQRPILNLSVGEAHFGDFSLILILEKYEHHIISSDLMIKDLLEAQRDICC